MKNRKPSTKKALRRTRWAAAALLPLLLLAAPDPLRGEFYRYVDEDGSVHYVDDLGRIPPERRSSAKAYQSRPDDQGADGRPGSFSDPPASGDGAGTGTGPLESPVTIWGNQILVPAVLGFKGREVDVTFLLDTGASVTTLHKDALTTLGLYGGIPSRMQVVGGKTIPSRMVEFDFIQVGPLRFERVTASVLEHSGPAVRYHGLLGMNVLRHADYTIDFDRHVIRWRPKGLPQPSAGTGG